MPAHKTKFGVIAAPPAQSLYAEPVTQLVGAAPARKAMDTEFDAPIELTRMAHTAEGNSALAGGIDMQPFWRNWPNMFDYLIAVPFNGQKNPFFGALRRV